MMIVILYSDTCVLIENFGLKEIGYELDLTVSSYHLLSLISTLVKLWSS